MAEGQHCCWTLSHCGPQPRSSRARGRQSLSYDMDTLQNELSEFGNPGARIEGHDGEARTAECEQLLLR